MMTVDEYIAKSHHLVPPPTILPKLLPLLQRADTNTKEIVDVISFNPSLTANMLRVCNSAFFSRGIKIDSLQEAVNRLGIQEVYQIVTAILGAVTLASPQNEYGVEAEELWNHSVTVAVSAQLIAKELGIDENAVFTAALLHDVGKIILAASIDTPYERFVQDAKASNIALVDTETKLLGANHAEVGGRLLQTWGFPENLIKAVRFHHFPIDAGEYKNLAACVYLGNFIAYFMGNGYGHHALSTQGRDSSLKILRLYSEDLPQYMMKSMKKLNDVKNLFQFNN